MKVDRLGARRNAKERVNTPLSPQLCLDCVFSGKSLSLSAQHPHVQPVVLASSRVGRWTRHVKAGADLGSCAGLCKGEGVSGCTPQTAPQSFKLDAVLNLVVSC